MDIVYQITDTITNLKYIGSKKNWQGYGTYFGSPNCKSKRFKKYAMQVAWRDALFTRRDTFKFDILESHECLTHDLLLERELFWQKKFDVVRSMEFVNAGFAKKGFCGDIYAQLTPEAADAIKAKVSTTTKAKMSKMTDQERKERYGRSGEQNGNYGNRWNDEQRENASKMKKEYFETHKCYRAGKTNIELFGGDRAAEIGAAISEAASGRIGEKNSFYGKTHNEKTRKILSDKRKGKQPINTKKVKIGDQVFSGLVEASKATGVKVTTIWHRIHSPNPKYESYSYID